MTKQDQPDKVMVELIKVGKSYPPDIEALKDVSLTVAKGELLFLTGLSGAGKTSLLRLLCRIEHPDRGLVEIDGMDIGKLPAKKMQHLRRRIGIVYQDFKLLPEQSVSRNIALPMEITGRQKSFIRKQTRTLLERLGLKDKKNTRAGDLSRGEQQRVAIARALCNKPDLILADEPTGNLDTKNSERVMDLFKEHRDHGATIMIATHDSRLYGLGEQRVVVLANGNIIGAGIKRELPQTEEALHE
jgi:cell division transport system ATP-binding protein